MFSREHVTDSLLLFATCVKTRHQANLKDKNKDKKICLIWYTLPARCLFVLKLTALKFNNYYKKLLFLTNWVMLLFQWTAVCKVGVLQYFLHNYRLAHLKAVLTLLFFPIYVCLSVCDCQNKRRSFLCTEKIQDMESKKSIVMVSS